MTVLVNAAPVSLPVGSLEIGPLTLPQGTQNLGVTYDVAAWPATADGQITVTLKISDDGGTSYRDEWHDTFQHVQLKRGGTAQSTASFGIGLQPFGANSRLRVAFLSTVAISTIVTVTAV